MKKNVMKILLIIIEVIVAVLAVIYVNHYICLKEEKKLLTPLGKVVEVDGHQMSVYVEGSGNQTLVFMSGGGTGFDKETWRRIPKQYIARMENAEYIELDCPHYIHDYEYERISEEIAEFLNRQVIRDKNNLKYM